MKISDERIVEYKEFLNKLSLRDLAVEAIRVNSDFELGKLSFNALLQRIDAIDRDFTILEKLLNIKG